MTSARTLSVVATLLGLLNTGCTSLMNRDEPVDESAGRASVGLHLGVLPSASSFEGAFTLTTALSVKRWRRAQFAQLRADVKLQLGRTLTSERTVITAAPTLGVDVFPWSPIGLKLELGAMLRTVYGVESDLGLGVFTTIGWVIRFRDPRHQLNMYASLEAMGFTSGWFDGGDQQHFGGGLGVSYEFTY